MGATLRQFGDWAKAGILFRTLETKLVSSFQIQLGKDADLALETMKAHIMNQDLDWAPLSEETIAKKGHDMAYIETTFLYNNLSVRKVRAPKNGITLFIGASPWKTHAPSGEKFSDIMIWLEYGAGKIPPRPLIEPTLDEIEESIEKSWEELLKKLAGGE